MYFILFKELKSSDDQVELIKSFSKLITNLKLSVNLTHIYSKDSLNHILNLDFDVDNDDIEFYLVSMLKIIV